MRISSSAKLFPLPPKAGWGMFDKKPKPPSKEFTISLDFIQSISQIPTKSSERCSKCGAVFPDAFDSCPICQPYLLKENQIFYDSKIIVKPVAKIILVLFDLSLTDKELEVTILNFQSVFGAFHFPQKVFFAFGFVSSFITIFQTSNYSIRFAILSPEFSSFAFILPIDQNIGKLMTAAKSVRSMFETSECSVKQLLNELNDYTEQYNFTDIVYIFKGIININKPMKLNANFHFVQINDKEDAPTKDFCSINASLFIHSNEFTKEVAQRVLISVLKTVKVPLVLEFRCSPGFILSFPDHRFINASYDMSSVKLCIKQVSSDLKIIGALQCKKEYAASKEFSLETCLSIKGMPPLIEMHKWTRANTEEEFSQSSVL